MAGLSHALAESEFHLSVLRGSVLMLPLLLWPIHQLAGLVITMASCSQALSLVGTAVSAAIRTTSDDRRNMAGLQAFRTAALLASEAWSKCPVRRPLNCGNV